MKNIFKGDKAIWYIFILLLSISLIEVLSAGSYLVMKEGSFTAVIMQQVTFAFISLMAAWSIHFIKCYKYKFLLLFGNFFSILFLIVALVSGQSINNGARWVHIAGISFQPSEIAKGVLIVGTATLIANEYQITLHHHGAIIGNIPLHCHSKPLNGTYCLCLLLCPFHLLPPSLQSHQKGNYYLAWLRPIRRVLFQSSPQRSRR